jgi:hypothetical protein
MHGRSADCNGPVVTTETDPKYFGVINPVNLLPNRGHMAGFTVVRGLHVAGVFTIL